MRTSMVRERSVDSSEIKVVEKEVCIDVDGKEISLEEARKKIGTTFYRRRRETLQVHTN